jgi:membrane fusion protein, heavy metal efflux system
VTAPIAGVVIERHANAGETAGSEPLFVIADYDRLWAELSLFPRDLARVKAGQAVQVEAVDGGVQGEGRVVRVAPAGLGAHGAPSGVYVARAEIDNAGGQWTPGLFVKGVVRIGEAQVPLAVKRSGLQAFRDFTVVFAQVGETYEVRMLELGRQDETWVEVLGGLEPGTSYVAENSYLIKADIEKSGASHDH